MTTLTLTRDEAAAFLAAVADLEQYADRFIGSHRDIDEAITVLSAIAARLDRERP